MKRKLVILCTLMFILNSKYFRVTALSITKSYGSNKFEYFKLEKYKVKIAFKSDLKAISDSNSGAIKFIDKNGSKRGGIYLVGYYPESGSVGLPNHSRILSEANLITSVGNGTLYVLERSMPAASNNTATWDEVNVIVPIENRQLAFDFMIKSSRKNINADKKVIINIVKNIEIK